MLDYLEKITSLDNLGCHEAKGQIATLLILFMVAIIIFILATVNIGVSSLASMKVATVTDTASLQLASILATAAHAAYKNLNYEYEVVMKGGAAAKIAAFIATALCFALGSWVPGLQFLLFFGTKFLGLLISLMIVGGVVGGVVGGFTIGDKAGWNWKGASQGARDGIKIGAMVATAGYGIQTGISGIQAGKVIQGEMADVGAKLSAAGAGATPAADLASGLGTLGANLASAGVEMIVGTAIDSAFALGFGVYNEIDRQATDAAVAEAIGKNIAVLPDSYSSIREGILYAALSQIVQDTKRVSDKDDIDGDEITDETITAFDQWFYERVKAVKESSVPGLIDDLIEKLEEYVLWYNGSSPFKNPDSLKEFINQTDRYGVECTDGTLGTNPCCSPVNPPITGINYPEGRITELFRDLKSCSNRFNAVINNNLYDPAGPNRTQLQAWYDCKEHFDFAPDDACTKPLHFDELDSVHEIYKKYVDMVQQLKNDNEKDAKDPEALRNSDSWVDYLYSQESPESVDTLYGGLNYLLNKKTSEGWSGLREWAAVLKGIRRDRLNRCQLAYDDYYPDQLREVFGILQGTGLITLIPTTKYQSYICGKAYDPREGENHFYPCVWEKEIYNSPVAGVFFPNYPCRVSPEDKVSYVSQLAALSNFVSNLENYIRTDSRNTGIFNDLKSKCPPTGQATRTQPNYSIIIRKISLAGDKQQRCSTITTRYYATITYEFQVSLRCCDSSVPPSCLDNVASSTATRSDILSGVNGVRDITGIKEVDNAGTSAESKFLAVIDNMVQSVNATQTSDSAYFASTDSDLDDEFDPVIKAIEAQETTINNIRTAIYDYMVKSWALQGYTGPKHGGGKVTYCWPDGNNNPPLQGCTSVGADQYAATVETGKFRIPEITHEHKKFIGDWLWHKDTYTLKYHCDNIDGCGYYDKANPKTWVKVSLSGPANTAVTSSKMNLGLWNPFRGSGRRTITRTTYPSYSVSSVGIAKRKR